MKKEMTRLIAIASGKGGTGKTTIAVNLSIALNDLGKNVILLDGNMHNPHVSLHLGVNPPAFSMREAILENKKISDAIYLHSSGLKFIPNKGSVLLNDSHANRIPEFMLELLGMCDIAIIDLGASLTKEKLLALQASDETIIVTNPELSALLDAKRVIKTAEELGSVVIGVVVNKVRKNFSESRADMQRYLNKAVISMIPDDINVQKSLHLQHPVIYSAPNSKASSAIRELAYMLT